MAIRFKTLVKKFGTPVPICEYAGQPAASQIVTIFDYGYGIIGYHTVDVSERYAFPQPFPPEMIGEKVIGCYNWR